MTQTIVVLGGSFVGLQVAHRLVKNTRKTVNDLKVILVSKNSHFYWNLASVRAIVPGILKDEEFSQPIEKGFSKYPAEAFEFIVGTAEATDLDAKTVKISTADGGERVLSYDHLVLATGTRTAGQDPVPWKASGTHEEIMDQLHKTADKVKAAKHIVVAGAGATGVEVASELGFEYGKTKAKEIVLLSADEKILGGDIVASNGESELKKLGVAIKTKARVTGTTVLPDGKTEITLQSGEKITTDLYLPTMGMAANTEYLPEKVLRDDGTKFVAVDEFYRVKNATNIWAAGDIVWLPRGGFVLADKQAAGVAKNIDLVLHGKNPMPVKTLPMDIFVVATGRSRGVGRLGSVKVFSYFVYMAKGKTLGVQQLPSILNGTAY